MLNRLRQILHTNACSCVIGNGNTIAEFHQRGIKDLYDLLHNNRPLLDGASVADKVIGKGAAALMIAGGVKEVYADVISNAAMELFEKYATTVSYDQKVAYIVNRRSDGICPVEERCAECNTIEECLVKIDEFVKSIM